MGLLAAGLPSLLKFRRRRPAHRKWREELLLGNPRGPKVAMIPIHGPITSTRRVPGGTADDTVLLLHRAIEDPKVTAVILDLETPGGAVVSSDIIHRKVREVRRKGKPAVALMGDVAASGGYYIAAAANEIVANSATLTGSIGAIWMVANLEGTADKIGLKPTIIKSGTHKDIASPFRKISPEDLKILQTLIDQAYGQFVAVVSEGRRIEEEKVREIADGRIYTGAQARELGLIDHLGGRELALRRARELADAPRAGLVRYVRAPGILENLVRVPPRAVGLEGVLGGFPDLDLRPGLKYLWLP